MWSPVDDGEQREIEQLLRIIDNVDPYLAAVTDQPAAKWTAQVHSQLSEDDALTHPYRVSHRAWLALTVAVDFIATLRGSLLGEKQGNQQSVRLHSYGQAGLLRGAVENAACAVFLVGPASRPDRVTNRLWLEWSELRPAYRLRELAGAHPPRTIEERRDQLVGLLEKALPDLAAQSGGALKVLRQKLDYSFIVQRGGELTPNVGADMAEAAWRMCSGLAHGDASASIGLLDKVVVARVEPGVNLMQMSAPVQLMVSVAATAFLLLTHAFGQFEARVKAPF